MRTLEQIIKEAKIQIHLLVNHGELVCKEFKPTLERNYSINKYCDEYCYECGYSQYIHLCKELTELNK